MRLPALGLGTWLLKGHACTKVVERALQLGYRHIDTAHYYDNHQAIRKGMQGVSRDTLYLTSKIDIDRQIKKGAIEKSVKSACDKALKELGTGYLDLYLIHWPNRELPMEAIFQAMEELKKEGKVREVGVSNFTIHHLQDFAQAGLTPFANQVEFHPHLYQADLLNYCNEHNIKLISYRPFGKGELLTQEPLFKEIGNNYEKTPAQVVLRWLIQKKIPTIPKASSEEHLAENIDVLDFTLKEEEIDALDKLHCNKRYCMADDPELAY